MENEWRFCYIELMAINQEKFKQDVIAVAIVFSVIVTVIAIFGGFS